MPEHQVKEYFPDVSPIKYEGRSSQNVLAYHEYNPEEVIMGKSMKDWMRFSVCYWHTFCGTGADPFGPGTFDRSWNHPLENNSLGSNKDRAMEAAKCKADAAFELFKKLGVPYFTFHDVDLVNEGENLADTQERLDEIVEYIQKKMQETGVKCLWATANLFSNVRFMNGGSTNPDIDVYARAAANVKKTMEIGLKLGAENFVFWGGREGFQSVLNTDTKKELDHMAAFFKMVVAYKKKIGANFQFLLEPKPREPMKHQYDYDAATCMSFLQTYGLQNDFKLNIEPNHTTLAGHDYEFDIYHAANYGYLGSIDCNTGDTLVGWDTDQFLMDDRKAMLVMKKLIEIGGLAPGGLNFDCKVRRESTDPSDLFIAHVGAMDCFARGLRLAVKVIEDGKLQKLLDDRYASWKSELGQKVEKGECTLEELEAHAKKAGEPKKISGKQELAEVYWFRAPNAE